LAEITTMFWDLGGVLLNNAWDHDERGAAISHFQLDLRAFEERHHCVVAPFERGEIDIDEYLNQTLTVVGPIIPRDVFKDFMFSCSRPNSETLEIARQARATGKYLMSTLNNESADLNLFRIKRFGLREIFDLFVSSCFVGLQKPDPNIYRLALNITQRRPQECCFIDDRPENLIPARELGMNTIHMVHADQLRADLTRLGIELV